MAAATAGATVGRQSHLIKEVVVGSLAAVPHLRRLCASAAVMRLFAVLVGVHGVAHLAGASGSFTKAADGESVDYLAGAWTVPDQTLLRAVGVVWALAGAAFLVAAAITWMRRPEWPRVLAGGAKR
jgi:hypothetical protein